MLEGLKVLIGQTVQVLTITETEQSSQKHIYGLIERV